MPDFMFLPVPVRVLSGIAEYQRLTSDVRVECNFLAEVEALSAGGRPFL